MHILRIEHKVPNFEGWKKAFDTDPIDRRKSGIKCYHIYRASDDPLYVIIDLEFDNLEDAQRTLAALRKLWERVEGSVMFNPQVRILEMVESITY